METAINLD